MNDDAKKVLRFIEEIDQMKNIDRSILLNDGQKLENNAEHSWHISLMVWLFSSFFEHKINLEKAIKMALIHDLVEIYAGDIFAYDFEARKEKPQKEVLAAQRLFKLLPKKQKEELFSLWTEYEERKTPEAKLVHSMDKLQPIIQNSLAQGEIAKKFKVSESMIRNHKSHYHKDSVFLNSFFEYLIKDAKRRKYLK
jgi:putative hydrolase of HD superfamily